MELEHIIWISVAFVISIFVVWVVWALFCQDKGDSEDDKSDREDSDSFSSTHVITSVQPKKLKRKRKMRRAAESSCNETTDEECEGTLHNERANKPRRKSRHERTSYRYQENKYGLHDPFGEWAPKEKIAKDTTTLPALHNYPKSPSFIKKHKPPSHTVLNM